MQAITWALALSTLLALAGCDSRVQLQSDQTPFSVGTIALGAPKDGLASSIRLVGCSPASANYAQCGVDTSKARVEFFGAQVESIRVSLFAPYTHIASISFTAKDLTLTRYDVEKRWRMDSQCLNRLDIDQSQRFDRDTSGYFMRALQEMELLPSYGEFICLGEGRTFLQFTSGADKGDAKVRMYYLPEVHASNFGYLFRSMAAMEKARAEVDKAFAPKTARPRAECGKKYRPDDDSHASTMTLLASDAGFEDGANRYFSDFVSALCSGDDATAKNYVTNGIIPYETAQHVARHYSLEVLFDKPTPEARQIAQAQRDLAGRGLNQVIAGHAAIFAILRPHSDCGRLALDALAGNADALDQLNEDPALCQWQL